MKGLIFLQVMEMERTSLFRDIDTGSEIYVFDIATTWRAKVNNSLLQRTVARHKIRERTCVAATVFVDFFQNSD